MAVTRDALNSALQPDEPRYLSFAQALAKEITSGKRPVGSLLPTETEFCQQSGLSRYAVRQAIERLIDLGLVSRQQGIGTRVVASEPPARYVLSMGDLGDLTQYAQGTEFSITEKRSISTTGALCELLSCDAGQKWLHIGGIRYSGGENSAPISLVSIYVLSAYSRLPGLSGVLKTPVYSLIEQHYGVRVTRVAQEIRGQLIRKDDAQRLDVKAGSAGLLIVRRYFVGTSIIEVTTGLHPAERFSYSMTFELASTGASSR